MPDAEAQPTWGVLHGPEAQGRLVLTGHFPVTPLRAHPASQSISCPLWLPQVVASRATGPDTESRSAVVDGCLQSSPWEQCLELAVSTLGQLATAHARSLTRHTGVAQSHAYLVLGVLLPGSVILWRPCSQPDNSMAPRGLATKLDVSSQVLSIWPSAWGEMSAGVSQEVTGRSDRAGQSNTRAAVTPARELAASLSLESKHRMCHFYNRASLKTKNYHNYLEQPSNTALSSLPACSLSSISRQCGVGGSHGLPRCLN